MLQTAFRSFTEFMRDILREKKQRLEADELRAGVMEDQDAISDRTSTFSGDLKADMARFRERKQ